MDEDAPVNSVAGGGVSMPPDAVQDKKKKKEIMTRLGTTVKENKETNSVLLNQILDQMDKIDVIVDEKYIIGLFEKYNFVYVERFLMFFLKLHLEILVDRLIVEKEMYERITESVELALKLGKGLITVYALSG